jgi:integrase
MSGEITLFEYRRHRLVKRADSPNLYIYWLRPGTRRVRRRTTGTGDVEQAKRQLIVIADERGFDSPVRDVRMAPVSDRPAILDTLSTYVDRLGTNRISHEQAAITLKHWIAFCEKHDVVYVDELSLDVQERYVAFRRDSLARQDRPCSNGTVNRELGVLCAAMRYAWKRNRLASVPFVQKLPTPPPRDFILSAEQAVRLLQSCDAKYLYRYVLIALHTLQRPTAIFELHRDRVDLASGLINFLPKGSMQSNKRRPIVPMTATLSGEMHLAIPESVSGFIIERDGIPLVGVRRAFATAVQRANLPEDTTPYVLRHTGASLLAAAGVPMHIIAMMLGHTNQRTTEMYVKRRPDYLREAVTTLDRLYQMPISGRSPNCSPNALQTAPFAALQQRRIAA